MRSLVLIAATVALAACSQEAEEAPSAAEATETVAAPGDMAAATSVAASAEKPGTYMATWADGSTTTTVVNADGTYTDAMDGNETGHGTWVLKEEKTCFTPEGGAELCWTDSEPASDGSWTATADDGTEVTVVKTPAVTG